MEKNIDVLPLEVVKGPERSKYTKDKDIYELKKVRENTYFIKPFTMLFYNGNFNEYLKENNIVLCYVIGETDDELKMIFEERIKRYTVNNDGLLELNKEPEATKKIRKRNFTK